MTDSHTTSSRIDADRAPAEPSPSTGWRETAALMHVTAGTSPAECDVAGCDRAGEAVRVVADDDTDTVEREENRCPTHAKTFLEVSS